MEGRPMGEEEEEERQERQEKVVQFMEIVGESAERARQFLEATGWQLEEAVQLFFVETHEGGGSKAPISAPVSQLPEPSVGPVPCPPPASPADWQDVFCSPKDLAGEDYVRPPLPVKREALYEDIFHYRAHRMTPPPNQATSVDAFRNFEDEANQRPGWGPGEASSQASPVGGMAGSRDSLAALYRPPFVLMFQGTFEQAKSEAARQGKWLLVNLQSTREFSSYMLNRDTWAHEAVKDTVGTSFVFWQVYDDTEEGRKVCTYYKLILMPTTLVLDPLTGQKMRAWEGMISAERFLEDLVPYMDRGPMDRQPIGVPPQKRPRESTPNVMDSSRDVSRVDLDEDDELQRALAASLEDPTAQVPDAGNLESTTQFVEPELAKKELPNAVAGEASKPITYPELPEEPVLSNPSICRVGIRFPDGRRGQRKFSKTDPIKLLWSYCSSQVPEAANGRKFHLNQTIPGATLTLDYSSEANMLEAGVANSMLSMTWD
ncbi:unnamed protein product [Sphagnum balticum]